MPVAMATPSELFGGTIMSPVVDPYPTYRRLRREAPVQPFQAAPGFDTHLVTRREDVLTILRDPELFSSKANANLRFVMGRTILEMDGTEHLRHRKLISPSLLPRALKGDLPGAVADIAHRMVDLFARDGRADLVTDFTFTFPLRVFTQQFFEIPVDDYEQFHRWGLELIGLADDPMKAMAAAESIIDYLQPMLDERRENPGDDLLSVLVNAEIDGDKLGDDELLGFCRLLVPAGAETTYRLLGNALYALLTHPEQLEEVRGDPHKLGLVIEETLRWESPVQYASRLTTTDTTFGGAELPRSTVLTVALGSANRDEEHYDEPDRFDMHRDAGEHLAFSFGQHFCAGTHLARLEAKIALQALLERLPNLRLDPDVDAHVVGLAFRAPDRLPVLFDAETTS